jgi:hypothetical protein
MDIQRCYLFGPVSANISKFKLKQVYAARNTSMHSRASVEIRSKSQSFIIIIYYYYLLENRTRT